MVWIKRNLFFVIGSLVALGLMGVGVFYLLKQISEEQRLANDIQKHYATLTTLTTQKPHPGAGAIDNIAAAKEQAAKLRDIPPGPAKPSSGSPRFPTPRPAASAAAILPINWSTPYRNCAGMPSGRAWR